LGIWWEKIMKKRAVHSLWIFLIIVLLTGQAHIASALTVKIDPAKVTLSGVGSTFTVSVLIDGVANLGGFQLNIHYDPAIVKINDAGDVTLGPFLGSTGNNVSALGPLLDNNTGKVTFGGFSFGANPGPNGSGTLAMIKFTVQSLSTGILDLNKVQVTNTQGTALTVDTVGDAVLQVARKSSSSGFLFLLFSQ
jgi:hypothetical protein